jgi:hypothetical protein
MPAKKAPQNIYIPTGFHNRNDTTPRQDIEWAMFNLESERVMLDDAPSARAIAFLKWGREQRNDFMRVYCSNTNFETDGSSEFRMRKIIGNLDAVYEAMDSFESEYRPLPSEPRPPENTPEEPSVSEGVASGG